MPIKIKPSEEIKANYAGAISEAERRYKTAVARTTGVIDAALKGQKNYVDQMSNSQVLARREAALRKTTDADWQKGALNIGSKRIGDGMRNAIDAQSSGFAPFRDEIANTDLPERTTDVDANIERVRVLAKRLNAKKMALLSS
jgi:hypothetical protein